MAGKGKANRGGASERSEKDDGGDGEGHKEVSSTPSKRSGRQPTIDIRSLMKNMTPEDQSALQDLCEGNGITEEQFLHRAHLIDKLEMFQNQLSTLRAFQYFQNVTQIQIMAQPLLTSMSGLSQCTELERLWICECNVSKIEGLENCTKLKQLYLYSNKLSKVEGLSTLEDLEVLWLCNNNIRALENLESLQKLRVLNMGRNKIERVGESLMQNTVLEELVLADNQIGCFKEILNLSRIPSLKILSFNDPHFGENPVCLLCNYQTYCLYHLNHLSQLDYLPVTDEARQLAEATYMKKKMYYNMRIKTLKRNTTNVIKKALDVKQARISQINLNLNVLMRQKKDIERELDERKYLQSSESEDDEDDQEVVQQLQVKYQSLLDAIEEKEKEIERTEAIAEEVKDAICKISEQNINRLIVELETGGNIRLEDGKPTDVWYTSCVDLMNSRFFAQDFLPYGVVDMKVHRVTRIHNRFLRNRFEERLDMMVDVSDASYKRSLEYLFYGNVLSISSELYRVAEEGFRTAEEYEQLGLDAAVPLSNSVSASDLPRVQQAWQKRVHPSPDGNPFMSSGQMIITKVFLAKCTAEQAGSGTPRADGDEGRPKVSQEEYKPYNSVYRTKATDSKQRQWFVFDNSLVLPEYLIEFDYITKKESLISPQQAQSAVEQGLKGLPSAQSEAEAIDMSSLTRPLIKFAQLCLTSNGSDPYDDVCSDALNMPPVLAHRTKIFLISEEVILKTARTNALTNIMYLNMHGNSIRTIENLGGLCNLKTLILSFNEIHKMDGLSELRSLEKLDLGFNLIKRIENLKGLNSLTQLELNNNLIYRLEDVNVIKKFVPELKQLNMRNNAVCEVKSYRVHVFRRLSKLEVFDGQSVSELDRMNAAENAVVMTDRLIQENAFAKRRNGWCARIATGIEEVDSKYADENVQLDINDPNWWDKVEELELNHRRLRKIQNMERLTNLRRSSFCDNELARIEGLECCTKLEELSLEENRLVKIEGLTKVVNLKKLDLGKNKITKVENIEHLTNLTQLSLEDNEITNLAGLNRLTNLMELYMGNNRVTSVKEVPLLKELPKLIILDLHGNSLCNEPDYRMYTIYHLRKLKVLDGLGIEAAEQQAAKEKYSGRLTVEFLVEKIGHKFFEHIRELDLSSCKIREIENIHGEEFCNLRELNLDNNLITDVVGLSRLPSLAVLRLNHNRIDSLSGMTDVDGTSRGLCALKCVEVLQLGFNQISSIPALQLGHLPELKVLFLQGNDISRIEGLDNLLQLRELVMDKNKVKQIDQRSFISLTNLRELRLEENGMRSLSNIYPLPKLQSLYLGTNRIVEIAELEKLSCLPNISEITLSNNPVARKQLYRPTLIRRIPTLRLIDSREVSYDERERAEVLLQQDQRPSPTFVPDPRLAMSRVPLQLKAMNFDCLTGINRSDYGGQSSQAAAGVPVLAFGAPPNGQPKEGDWHPYTNSTEDFFLPKQPSGGRDKSGRDSARKADGKGPPSNSRPSSGEGNDHYRLNGRGSGLRAAKPTSIPGHRDYGRILQQGASGSRAQLPRARNY